MRYLGVWMWQESHQEAEYVNWKAGEPNNDGGNEDCVYKYSSYSDLWNDSSCDYRVPHALCQAEK